MIKPNLLGELPITENVLHPLTITRRFKHTRRDWCSDRKTTHEDSSELAMVLTACMVPSLRGVE